MKLADWYVSSSSCESFGLTIQEALVLGVPVLTTDCPGAVELFRDGRDGLVVENSDWGLLVGMKTILDNPELHGFCQASIIRRQKEEMPEGRMAAISELLLSPAVNTPVTAETFKRESSGMSLFKFIGEISFLKTLYHSLRHSGKLNIVISRKTRVRLKNADMAVRGKLRIGRTWNGYARTKTSFLAKKNSRVAVDGTFVIYSGCDVTVEENAVLSIGSGAINCDCKLNCFSRISIGNDVYISENAVIRGLGQSRPVLRRLQSKRAHHDRRPCPDRPGRHGLEGRDDRRRGDCRRRRRRHAGRPAEEHRRRRTGQSSQAGGRMGHVKKPYFRHAPCRKVGD